MQDNIGVQDKNGGARQALGVQDKHWGRSRRDHLTRVLATNGPSLVFFATQTLHAADNKMRTVPGRRPVMRACSLRRQLAHCDLYEREDGEGRLEVCSVAVFCTVVEEIGVNTTLNSYS